MSFTQSSIQLPAPEGPITLDGFECNRYAFAPQNVTGLLPQADARGDNLVVPDLHGVDPMPFFRAQTEVSIPFAVAGDHDLDGDPVYGTSAQLWQQLKQNWMYLHANMVGPFEGDLADPSIVTKELEWTGQPGDAFVFRGDVQVRGMKTGRSLAGQAYGIRGLVMLATMRLFIIDGELGLVASP